MLDTCLQLQQTKNIKICAKFIFHSIYIEFCVKRYKGKQNPQSKSKLIKSCLALYKIEPRISGPTVPRYIHTTKLTKCIDRNQLLQLFQRCTCMPHVFQLNVFISCRLITLLSVHTHIWVWSVSYDLTVVFQSWTQSDDNTYQVYPAKLRKSKITRLAE